VARRSGGAHGQQHGGLAERVGREGGGGEIHDLAGLPRGDRRRDQGVRDVSMQPRALLDRRGDRRQVGEVGEDRASPQATRPPQQRDRPAPIA